MTFNRDRAALKPVTEALRKRFATFSTGQDQIFEFGVACEIKDRIWFIYQVIFTNLSKPLFYLRFLMSRLAQHTHYPPLKAFFYRCMGVKMGKKVFISPDTFLDPHFPHLITLEDHVILGLGTRLFCHEFDGQTYMAGKVTIREGAVIGGASTIRAGVTVGRRAFVATGSWVGTDVPDGARFGLRDLAKKIAVDTRTP